MTDFEQFMYEIGLTQMELDRARQEIPLHELKPLSDRLYAGPSSIHGIGIFAQRNAPAGVSMDGALRGGIWTQAGVICNHSSEPNVQLKDFGMGFDFVSTRAIEAGEELTCDYRHNRQIIEGEG